MQGKAPLSQLPGSAPPSDGAARRARDDMWVRFPPGPGEKPKQVEAPAGLILVPIDSIEELDRSQQLLSTMIKLAVAVSNERLKAERASVNVRRLSRGGASGGDADQWHAVAEQVEEIESLGAMYGKPAAFSEQVRETIERFHEARKGAGKTAEEIVAQLTSSGVELPEADRMREMLRAIVKLCRALKQCALACDSESQDRIKQIDHRLQSILERIEGQQEPSTKPTGEKRPSADQENESESSAAMDDRKLTEPGGDGHLKQPREG